jgi:dihydroorotase
VPDEITLRSPDDFHVHLRREPMLRLVVRSTTDVYRRALVMPNTDPPILGAEDVVAYRDEILHAVEEQGGAAAGAGFTPLMAIKLTDATTPSVIEKARAAGAVAGKVYPSGVTTGSHGGISDFGADSLIDVFKAMRDCGMVLCVHAEMPGVTWSVAEQAFVDDILPEWIVVVPGLKMVVEHVSSSTAVAMVKMAPATVAATVTPMHLTLTDDDILGHRDHRGRRGLNPHNFCYPMPKTDYDRHTIREAVASGSPKFFAGDDSAPHRYQDKEAPCGCAGVFCAPASLPTYAEVFDELGCLDKLDDFTGRFGAEFYGLSLNEGTIRLVRSDVATPWVPNYLTSPGRSQSVRCWRAGERLGWVVAREIP